MFKTIKNDWPTSFAIVAFLLIIYYITNNTGSVALATSLATTASSTEEIAEYESIEKESVKAKSIELIDPADDELSSEIIQGDTKIYTNKKLKYSIQYPKELNIYEIPSLPYVRVESFDARKLSKKNVNDYFKIEVVRLPNIKSLSLLDWVEQQNNNTYPRLIILSQKEIEVARHPAIYQMEQSGQLIHPVVFIQKGNSVYLLNISPTYKKYDSIIKDFLKNFNFISNE